MSVEEPAVLRRRLLEVEGIGPETADSIALYAAGHPAFVVDAYTRRVFARLGHLSGGEPYGDVQRYFVRRLPRDAALFNDYHAQIVRLAKEHCRARPICPSCPLERVCAYAAGQDPGSFRQATRRRDAASAARPRPRRARVPGSGTSYSTT